MATLLLAVIYIAFIGLGLPDSLFGAAWPALYADLGIPVGAATAVTIPLNCLTMLTCFFSARIINRFGTPKVVAFSTAMTALGLLGFSFAGSLIGMIVLAVPLGLGAGCIDSALNNYVALHYKATQMSFLHCFYGIGVSISPYFMSLALAGAGGWRGGYRITFWIQLGITLLTFATLPLWNKVHPVTAGGDGEKPRTLRIREVLRLPGIRAVWCVFFGSCAVECTCGGWAATYLVLARGLSADKAAETLVFYYVGMALGRFLSGVLAARMDSRRIVRLGGGLILAALILLVLPLPVFAAGVALFLIGLGNGPVFPNMMHLTPELFGRDVSQSAIGSQMTVSYISIMTMPPLFGLLTQFGGASLMPYYLLAMFAILAVGILFLPRASGSNLKGDNA